MEKNYVALDIPFFNRILEECREGIESDAELHFLLDRIIDQQLTTGQVLTMDDYAAIMEYKVSYELVKNQLEEEDDEE